jgi:transposase
MCDALSRNTPKNVAVILARCLAHARRKFYEIKDDFPEECDVILDIIGHLYTIDRWIKDDEMSMENRLKHHQLFSAQAVDELYEYLEKLSLMEHIEPGTTLAQSIRYTMNHWEGLTLFLRKVGAPMDNNVCEQAIKVAILSRKNSYFYRSEDGAEAGDIFMSIIQTCAINKVSYFDYLVALQENQDEVIANPEKWLPWNCPKLVSAKNS